MSHASIRLRCFRGRAAAIVRPHHHPARPDVRGRQSCAPDDGPVPVVYSYRTASIASIAVARRAGT
jgi:hypothetical protein